MMYRPPTWLVIENYIKYRLSMKKKDIDLKYSPLSIAVYTNKACNFKCSFCYNQDVLNQKTAKNDEMTEEQFKNILNSFHGQRALRIAFLGGEPFLNKNIFKLFEIANQRRKVSNVVTNATQLKGDFLEKVVKSKATIIGISLYDNNREDVSRVVGRFNNSTKSYWVQTVGDAQHLTQLGEKIEYCQSIGVKNLILSNYNPYFDKKYQSVIYDDNQEWKALEKDYKKKYSKKMNIQWINPFPRTLKNKNCRMPFSYVHVDNRGQIGACCFRYPNEELSGNLLKPNSWNSEFNMKLRNNLLQNNEVPLSECEKCENLHRDLYGV